MGSTSIEWTDHSINPIRLRDTGTGAVGHYCEKISSGCANCYSSRLQKRFGTPEFGGVRRNEKYPIKRNGAVDVGDGLEFFLDRYKLREVLSRGKPTKFFWCDMTDLFGEWVPDDWIYQCIAVQAITPQHTHQVLTKRPERMARCLRSITDDDEIIGDILWEMHLSGWFDRMSLPPEYSIRWGRGGLHCEWPLSNLWLGVSCENQAAANERIPHLLRCTAAVRFISAEPLLGDIRFGAIGGQCSGCTDPRSEGTHQMGTAQHPSVSDGLAGISWLIAGDESGPKRRPGNIEWHRSLLAQCRTAGVAFFEKQLQIGGKIVKDISEFPEDLRVREFPCDK